MNISPELKELRKSVFESLKSGWPIDQKHHIRLRAIIDRDLLDDCAKPEPTSEEREEMAMALDSVVPICPDCSFYEGCHRENLNEPCQVNRLVDKVKALISEAKPKVVMEWAVNRKWVHSLVMNIYSLDPRFAEKHVSNKLREVGVTVEEK